MKVENALVGGNNRWEIKGEQYGASLTTEKIESRKHRVFTNQVTTITADQPHPASSSTNSATRMSGKATVVCVCATLCVIILIAEMVTAAPSYADYENSIRDLYELMLQKEALEERLGHQIVRKSSRSPSLRLRFGRRSDPNILSGPQFLLPQSGEPERLEN
ncbi:hypothetical protein CBL_04494 [Carabus blaptoides fortunei]